MLEDLHAAANIGKRYNDVAIEATGTNESLVEGFGEVGGCRREEDVSLDRKGTVRFACKSPPMRMTPSPGVKPSSSVRSWLRVCLV